MPYILNPLRAMIWRRLQRAMLRDESLVITDGETNYMITKILLQTKPKNYHDYNSLIGVLECVKLELYRRAVAAYEDKKIKENGDVY